MDWSPPPLALQCNTCYPSFLTALWAFTEVWHSAMESWVFALDLLAVSNAEITQDGMCPAELSRLLLPDGHHHCIRNMPCPGESWPYEIKTCSPCWDNIYVDRMKLEYCRIRCHRTNIQKLTTSQRKAACWEDPALAQMLSTGQTSLLLASVPAIPPPGPARHP